MISETDLKQKIKENQNDMFQFLRDIVAIPSQDGIEGKVIERICEEMKKSHFDKVYVDKMGNCIGIVGDENADIVLAYDAHIDTVDTGMLSQWSFDPYQGKEDEENIYGRGSCDQKAGLAAMVYAGKILKELGIRNKKIVMVASTLEEECEGLSWQQIIKEGKISPDAVISTEPTSMRVNLGHRGRTDISVEVEGRSAHGAMPERGINAVVRMSEIVREIDELSWKLKDDEFLGKGTLNISEMISGAASKCAVPDYCKIMIDRRLTYGETPESAIKEIENLPAVKRYGARVKIEQFCKKAYTGEEYNVPCKFPTWKMDVKHKLCTIAKAVTEDVRKETVEYGAWKFSTNGVAICGMYHIPCIGLGPGNEEQAHSIDEYVSKKQIVQALECYVKIAIKYYN